MRVEQLPAWNGKHVVYGDAAEGRTQRQFSNRLRVRDVADIENDGFGAIAHIRLLAVLADDGRTVEGDVGACGRLAILLAVEPPAARFLRIRRIADIDENQD